MELNSAADALSGIQANQTYMDTVGNNIANANTIAYRTQSIRFEDLLGQTMGYGTQATTAREGTNPLQIGMGVGQGEMKMIDTQGSVQDTGRLTDMAIQGGGYFVVNNGQQNYYTRDGSFNVAPDGTLTTANGMTVQGWGPTTAAGTFDTTAPAGAVHIPLGSVNATATTQIQLVGNLDASQAVYQAASGTTPASGGSFQTTMTVFDSQGASHTLDLIMQKTANNSWSYKIVPHDTSATPDVTISSASPSAPSGTLAFSASGALTSPANPPEIDLTFADGAAAGKINVDFSHISQVAGNMQVNVATADGATSGSISTFSVAKDGSVTAIYSNGTTKKIAQIALASFRNPDGLVRQGSNLFAAGANSGIPQVGVPGQTGLGDIVTGQLEGSNVDLATQFAQMIQAQQGFNANTKVITTTNNMMQSIISILP